MLPFHLDSYSKNDSLPVIKNLSCSVKARSASVSFIGKANHTYYVLFELLGKGIAVKELVDAPNQYQPSITYRLDAIEATEGDAFRFTVTSDKDGKSDTRLGEPPQNGCK